MNKFVMLLISFLVVPMLAVFASEGGGRVGNVTTGGFGGGVVVCKANNEIGFTSVAHDLYEGEHLYGLTYNYIRSLSFNSLDHYLNQQLARSKSEQKKLKKEELKVFSVLYNSHVQDPKLSTVLTEDLESEWKQNKIKLAEGCVIKNFIRYFVASSYQDPSLMKGFVNYQNEYLVLQKHETLYSMARAAFPEDSNSSRVRKLLAYAASDQVMQDGPARDVLNQLLEEWWSRQ